MAVFKSIEEGVEVNGETVFAIVDGMGAFKAQALSILEVNGINDPKPGEWYLQQKWLDAFKTISDEIGPNTLNAIGRKIPDNANFPPEIDSIEKGLSAIDVAYHMNHRNGKIGHYTFSKTGDREGTMVCNNPYPCAFDRGIIESMCKRFKPEDSVLTTVTHDDSKPCRMKGGNSCTYKTKW